MRGGLRAYLSRGSNWLKLANNALLLTAVGLWWTFVTRHARTFYMDLRYPVYADLEPPAHLLKLAGDGSGLDAAWEAFARLEAAIGVLNWYYALNGISILLLIARCACLYIYWVYILPPAPPNTCEMMMEVNR
jgi:hypothetical protein